MGKTVLLLRLEGPLQAWGTRARWDVRDTGSEPTKSGIVGLLGCAMGYRMGDMRLEKELDAGLRFGVRIENPGLIMEDFQTIDILQLISPRYYLEDAAFLVGLEENEMHTGLLNRCADKLNDPTWPIFLGRKSCIPTRPVFEALTDEYDDLEDALKYYPWSWLGSCKQLREPATSTLIAYIENHAGEYVRQDAMRVNPSRQYGFRHASRLPPIIPCMYQANGGAE